MPLETYGKAAALLDEAIANEQVILQYLEQPTSARIAAVVDETLIQADAFDAELAKSNDARLQRLAEAGQRASDHAKEARDAIESALKSFGEEKK